MMPRIAQRNLYPALLVFLLLTYGSTASASDWPRFMGPNGDCVAQEKGLMDKWPDDGPKILWSVPIGVGYAGPVAEAGKVYLLDRNSKEEDILLCLALADGKKLWSFSYKAQGKMYRYPGSRNCVTVDAKYIFAVGPMGHFHCIDKNTHKPVWKKHLLKDFDAKLPKWAVSQAPALHGDSVIVAPFGQKAGLAALNKDTGAVVWQSRPLKGRGSYVTPVVIKIGGVDQVVFSAPLETVGVDAGTGKVLWVTDTWQCRNPITSPVHLGDGKIFLTGGYGAGAAMLQVSKAGGGFKVETLYKTMECNCQIPQPVIFEGHFYLNGNDKAKANGFMCMTLDGNVRWKTKRSPGFDWGGLLLADGKIYAVDGNTGDLCMIKPDPTGYKEVGRAKVLKGKEIWGPIAMADGKILLRDQSTLKCVDVKGK